MWGQESLRPWLRSRASEVSEITLTTSSDAGSSTSGGSHCVCTEATRGRFVCMGAGATTLERRRDHAISDMGAWEAALLRFLRGEGEAAE